jgi:hypothetical protein
VEVPEAKASHMAMFCQSGKVLLNRNRTAWALYMLGVPAKALIVDLAGPARPFLLEKCRKKQFLKNTSTN